MIPLTITSSLSLSSSPFLPQLSLSHSNFLKLKKKRVKVLQRRGLCKAQLHEDAPFAAAIGACILNSLLFSTTGGDLSEDEDSAAMTSTDARTNLSLSPEESWLPIASIVICVVHIQLEASIYGGDLDGFNFFSEASKRLGLYEKQRHAEHLEEMDDEGKTHGNMKLPLRKQSKDDRIKWRVPRKPSQDVQHVDKDDEKQ